MNKKLFGFIFKVVLGLATIPALLFFAWAVAFSSRTAAIIGLCLVLVLLPVLTGNKVVSVVKFLAGLAVLVLCIVGRNWVVSEVNSKIVSLGEKLRSEPGLAGLTTSDKYGIWGLNVLLGLGGGFYYPEAGRETFMMVYRPDENGQRVFRSGFALDSKRIRVQLRDFGESLSKMAGVDTVEFGPVEVTWTADEFKMGKHEARFAYALNPTTLSAVAVRRDDRWKIDVQHTVEVGYSESLSVTLFEKPKLVLDCGLFWALQELGWLHPYTAVWRFSVYDDDSRID